MGEDRQGEEERKEGKRGVSGAKKPVAFFCGRQVRQGEAAGAYVGKKRRRR